MSTEPNSLAQFASYGITTISGFYDANGNELTTPKQLANYVGISDDLYNRFANDYSSSRTAAEGQDEGDAQQAVKDAVTASGKQYYDTASDITFINSDGDKYTYQTPTAYEEEHTPEFQYYSTKVSIGGSPVTSTMYIATSKATGD